MRLLVCVLVFGSGGGAEITKATDGREANISSVCFCLIFHKMTWTCM